jgi:hypothetical protein
VGTVLAVLLHPAVNSIAEYNAVNTKNFAIFFRQIMLALFPLVSRYMDYLQVIIRQKQYNFL